MMGSSSSSSLTENFANSVDSFEKVKETYMISLNASRLRRHTSSFESKVERFIPTHVERERQSLPGPGEYSNENNKKVQRGGGGSFQSSFDRFAEVMHDCTSI